MPAPEDPLTNSQIAELLALAARRRNRRSTGPIVGHPGRHYCGRKKLGASIRKGGRLLNCRASGRTLRESSADGLKPRQSFLVRRLSEIISLREHKSDPSSAASRSGGKG